MKKFIAPVIGLVAVLGLFAFDTSYAQLISPTDSPDNIAQSTTGFGGSIKGAIKTILDFFLFFLGIICVAMVIYGGFLYITAGGDDGGAEKGKKILTQAAIGVIIILLSFVFVRAIIDIGSGNAPV